MYEFHSDYIKKNGNKPRLLFADTDSLMYKIETKNVSDNFSKNKKTFDFKNYSAESTYYDHWNVLALCKMKDEMGDVAIEQFFGLKSKMYSILVGDFSEYKKPKAVNKNVVAKISHNKYKDVFLNKKYLRYSMNIF